MSTDPRLTFTMPSSVPFPDPPPKSIEKKLGNKLGMSENRRGALLFSSRNIMCLNDPYSMKRKVKTALCKEYVNTITLWVKLA